MTTLVSRAEDERDSELVLRHQAGDEHAFPQLYTRHYRRLVRYCERRVRDPHTAEELAQEAFLRAYLAIDRLHGERRFYPWLAVIARRLVIDHVRHQQARPAAAPAVRARTDPEENVLARMDLEGVDHALARLRERHRAVLALRERDGLSYREIGERLRLPATAVPPLLHRARAALRRELGTARWNALALGPANAVAWSRRVRAKLSEVASWVPDPAPLTAPLMGVVLTMAATASVGTPPAALGDVRAGAHAAADRAAAADVPDPSSRPRHEAGGRAPGHRHDHPRQPGLATPPERVVVDDVASVQLAEDREGARRMRERGRRQPIFLEAGPAGLAADPEEDARHFRELAERAATEGWEPRIRTATPAT